MDLRRYVKRPEDRIPVQDNDDFKVSNIFRKKSDNKGVLNHIDSFNSMILFYSYTKHPIENIQEIYYVVKGVGQIIIDKEKTRIERGFAFLVPPHTSLTLNNLSARTGPLELLVIKEEAPQKPRKDILIHDSEKVPWDVYEKPMHWCHKVKTLFNYKDHGLGKVHYVSLVYVDSRKIPEPHSHYHGHDEVWHALEGYTNMQLRDDLIEQKPGTSIFIPDNPEVLHSSINNGRATAKFFFFMHHMALDNRVLVTGSHGRIGRLVVDHLKNNRGYQFLTEIDRDNPKNSVDILYDDIIKYFREVDTVIHLAANPNPFLDEKGAEKNIAINKRLIDACNKSGTIKRIIYASSINVYPYRDVDRIRRDTPLTPNTAFNKDGHYGKSKIECERMLEKYCANNRISLINLRLGWVTSNNKFPPYYDNKPHQKDLEVALKHDDLFKIIDEAIWCDGINSYICVSKRDGFVDKDVLFPL